YVTRSHPLVATLADALLEAALEDDVSSPNKLGRIGVWTTTAVNVLTTVVLLRLRFKLTTHGRRERLLLVEEANAIAFDPQQTPVCTGEKARALLEEIAASNLSPVACDRLLAQARDRIAEAQSTVIAEFARERAAALAHDHER